MKDAEARGVILEKFYEARHLRNPYVTSTAIVEQVSMELRVVLHLCKQLDEQGLITWKGSSQSDLGEGLGKITARGVDVAEGTAQAGIAIMINDHSNRSISVSGSNNVQIGDSNQQTVKVEIGKLVDVIDRIDPSDAEKNEAKSLIEKITMNPLVVTALGTILGKVLS